MSILSSVRGNEEDDTEYNLTLNLSNGGSIFLVDYYSDEINTVASVEEVEPINVISNYEWDTVVTGTNSRDSIYNGGENVTVNSGEGNDTIQNYGASAVINTSDGDDYISNSGDDVLINSGTGNDSIENSGLNVTVEAGTDNDFFNESGYGTAYIYKGGNDTLARFNDIDALVLENVSIIGSDMNGNNNYILYLSNGNYIYLPNYYSSTINNVASLSDVERLNVIDNYESNTVVTGTATKDSIYNSGYYSTVNAGAGNDTIYNSGSYATIDGGAGDDYISSDYYSFVTVDGGEGNDTISNSSDFSLINGGAGNDTIYNNSSYATLTGGAGDDYIYNDGVNLTIFDDEGNDTFQENGVGTAYIYSGGSDTLWNFTIFDALILSDASINSSVKGDDNAVTLEMSNGGSIVLTNYDSDSIQTFATLDDYERYNIVESDYDQYSIAGTSGKDYINTWRDNATILALAGDDYVRNSGDDALVALGAGDDYISNSGDNVIVWGGEGNDIISNSGVNLIVIDDEGNDTFQENGIGTAYVYGGGSDTLQNFTGLDALILGDVSINSSVKSDDNTVTLEMSNGNSIVLTNYDSDSINALASLNDYEQFNIIRNSDDLTLVNGTDGKDYIRNYAHNVVINAGTGDDYIYNSYSYVSVNGGAGNDLIRSYSTNVSIDGGAGDDVITISSYYENNLIEYNAGDGNDTIYGFSNNATLAIAGGSYATERSHKDIVFKVGDGSVVLKNAATLSAINISDGTETTVIDNEPFVEYLTITNNTESPVTFQADIKTANASTRTKAIQITGNELANTITGGKGNDTLDGAEGNDVLTGGKGKDLFVFSGGNDIITDYENKDKLSVGGGLVYEDYTLDGDDLILNFGTDNILTIADGADKTISYLEDKKTTTTEYTADEVILGDKKKSATLTSAVEKFDASAKAYSKVETIDGTATGAIEIIGNSKKNYIMAGASGSTLNGGKANDTLVGGAGADVFVYENKSGKDVIEGYGDGDSIDLDSNVTIKDVKTKRGDTVLKFKGGALTVKGTTEFNIGETTYKNGVFIAGDTAKIYGSFKGEIDLANYAAANVDASEGKKKLTITGNASANSLTGGKGKDSLTGGAGDDTLSGGKGNDKLWGGDGKDTFIYQAGTGSDTIMDYDFVQGDLLTILNKRSEAGDFSKATFKKDTLTLSINGGGKVAFSGVASNTSININGNSRTVSELVK